MRTILKLLVISIVISPLNWANALASEDFSSSVMVAHNGPAILARIDNCGVTEYVVGYKKTGSLYESFNNGASSITAVITGVSFKMDFQSQTVNLGREWHQTGFMSRAIPMDRYSVFWMNPDSEHSGTREIMLSFVSSDGKWDSKDGKNYEMDFRASITDKYLNPSLQVFFYISKSMSCGNIPLDIWDFIVSEMSR